jgi:O-antigen ligase
VSIGIAAIMWFCGQLRGKIALWYVLIATVVLLLTHTRTALVAMFVALLVSGLSLIATSPRVRRLFAVVAAVTVVAFAAFSSAITSWMARGEGTAQLTNLTGRTNFWGPLLAYPRTTFQEIFGFGLSNGSFAGLPIDSNWMLSYQDQGLFGVVMCAVILLYVLIAACLQSRGIRRALALFLVIYCIVASFTEDGITNPSTYMLDVTVAASLLLPAATRRQA